METLASTTNRVLNNQSEPLTIDDLVNAYRQCNKGIKFDEIAMSESNYDHITKMASDSKRPLYYGIRLRQSEMIPDHLIILMLNGDVVSVINLVKEG